MSFTSARLKFGLRKKLNFLEHTFLADNYHENQKYCGIFTTKKENLKFCFSSNVIQPSIGLTVDIKKNSTPTFLEKIEAYQCI